MEGRLLHFRRRAAMVAAGLVWCSLILSGAHTLLTYENTPGAPGRAPYWWPEDSSIVRASDRFTLLMLAHPDCPCTRASLVQLEQLTARLRENLAASVLFGKPGSDRAEVEASDLWKQAAKIPGVVARYDDSGAEARTFGAAASGQTLLYDRAGRLAFSGGITLARGHQGYSAGEEAIIRAVTEQRGFETESPAKASGNTAAVFGCSLRNPAEDELKEDPTWKKR